LLAAWGKQGRDYISLLDSYEQERRDHAKAMINLSVLAGHVLAPPKRWQGTLRDGVSWLLNYLPPVKRYFVEMRFKPMPQYTRGALIVPTTKGSPVGKMFIQPKVLTDAGTTVLLDEVIGDNFAIIAWGCDPTWGLSATLGNLDQARDALLPNTPDAPIVAGVRPRTLTLDTLRPKPGERFPWSGHLGLAQLSRVLEKLLAVKTSLVFTNTRAQAELWHQALSSVWPEDPATLALHHGSLSPTLRAAAEQGLRAGTLQQLTRDHSWLQEQIDAGLLTPAQAATVGMRNLITRALGSEPHAAADINEFTVAEHDLYLLCSDGLTDMVADAELAEILRAPMPLTEKAALLIDSANAHGGRDNISVLLVQARVGARIGAKVAGAVRAKARAAKHGILTRWRSA